MKFKMTMTVRDATLLAFGVLGIVWYYTCLLTIGAQPPIAEPQASSFREFMSLSITTIGASLATFVGMLLGLRGVADDAKRDAAALRAAPQGLNDPAAAKLERVAASAAGTALQWWAAILYVGSLALAVFFWHRTGNDTDPAIVNLAKSLLGLLAGALAVVLNAPKT